MAPLMMARNVPAPVFEAIGRLCAYYAYLEGAVAQAIWLELKLEHNYGHPVTDKLQLRQSFELLLAVHKRAGRTTVVAHLKTLETRLKKLMEDRNLLIHGTVVFAAGSETEEPGVRWLMRRGLHKG